MPRSMRTSRPRLSISWWFSLLFSTVGQTETMSWTPISPSSRVMAAGSGQYSSSNFQSPWFGQWKKSATITERGRPRRLNSLATPSSSSWVW